MLTTYELQKYNYLRSIIILTYERTTKYNY